MLSAGDTAPTFTARPIFGEPITVPDAARRPLVLSFTGSLASPFSRRWLAAFQDHFADFDRRGVRVAAIARCAVADAQDFVPRYHLLFPLAAEPDGAVAEQYAVGTDRALLGSLRGGLFGELRGALSYGVGFGRGSLRTLPAAFYIDGDGTIQAALYSRSIAGAPDIEALLQCAPGS